MTSSWPAGAEDEVETAPGARSDPEKPPASEFLRASAAWVGVRVRVRVRLRLRLRLRVRVRVKGTGTGTGTGTGRVSDAATRPPGRSTRKASRSTCSLSSHR